MRLTHLLLTALFAMVGCTSAPTKPLSYQERLDQGRTRLAAQAEREWKDHPESDKHLLLYTILKGENAADLLEKLDPEPTPLLAQVMCQVTFFGIAGKRPPLPSDDEALEILDVFDELAPKSSLPPLYRVRWLCLRARDK